MGGALTLILGRSGSKGVPGKNLRPVAGRPCILWTIDAARASTLTNLVALSADGEALQRLGLDAGIAVVARPADLATDTATVDDAARHAVMELERGGAGRFDEVVILYANVPIRPAGLVDRAIVLLRESGADSVQSYASVGKHHPWWTAVVEEAGIVRPWEGDVLNHGVFRRQDLPLAHVPDGGVLAVTRRALFREIPGVGSGPHAFFGRDRRGIVNPEGSVVDIDSAVDLLVADALLRAETPEGPGS